MLICGAAGLMVGKVTRKWCFILCKVDKDLTQNPGCQLFPFHPTFSFSSYLSVFLLSENPPVSQSFNIHFFCLFYFSYMFWNLTVIWEWAKTCYIHKNGWSEKGFMFDKKLIHFRFKKNQVFSWNKFLNMWSCSLQFNLDNFWSVHFAHAKHCHTMYNISIHLSHRISLNICCCINVFGIMWNSQIIKIMISK